MNLKQDVFGNKWMNQTGSDYSNNPAGVNPQFVKYLASNGVLGNGDPLSTYDLKAVSGGDFGKFWEIVFPQGANDCDLQAAIANITDKLAQFKSMINFGTEDVLNNPNPIKQVGYDGLKAFVQQPSLGLKGGGCNGCQGDAHAYVSVSHPTLVSLLNKYNAIYNKHVQAGGGCMDGLLSTHKLSLNQSQRDFDQQLEAKMRADEWNIVEGRKKALAALQLGKDVVNQQTQSAPAQGAAAGASALAASMSPMKIFIFVALGVVGIGIISYFATRHKS